MPTCEGPHCPQSSFIVEYDCQYKVNWKKIKWPAVKPATFFYFKIWSSHKNIVPLHPINTKGFPL